MTDSLEKATFRPTPVLVVGAGPAGLTAAITLARYGVECLVIDRREQLSDQPRATAVSVRSMELLRSWGLESELLQGALDVTFLGRVSETLVGPGSLIPLGYPTPAEAAEVSPVAPVCAPQDHLEPVLLRHLRGLPAATVRFGAELVDVAAGTRGVLARIRDSRTGRLETVAARYLVGADGVRSRVREALGVAMHGPGLVGEGVVAHFHAPLWKRIERPHYVLYPVTHAEAPGTFVPSGRGDRWVYGVQGAPGTLAPGAFDIAAMSAQIRTASGIPELEPRIVDVGRFRYVAELAERFRVESAFLAGDAAHRVTPRGGTGMNTSIRDGLDIGWKLAWVLRGWASDALLDSYEAERRPVAEHNVRRSAEPNGSVREAAGELEVDLGGRIAHAWVGSGPGRRSTLDLLGPGLTLFTRSGSPRRARTDCRRRTARPPVTVRELPPSAADALGIAPGEKLAVRPDALPTDRCGRDALPSTPGPRRGSSVGRAHD